MVCTIAFRHHVCCPKVPPTHQEVQSAIAPSRAGNIGTYLYDRDDEVNTYLSRDAGLSWQEVAKGSFIYEMGDHGGLVVMAANGMKTSHFM